MSVGIRMERLSKIYTSAPAAALPRGAAYGMGRAPWKRKKQAMRVVALDDISLEVRSGEVFGLLGPNGAGKTTTVGILTTRVRPSAGEAWIGTHNVWKERVQVKRLIGVVPQRPNLDFSLTAREILTFHGAYFQVPPTERTRRAAELLERFKLADRADELLLGFSGGMMQRLSIARAMMHDPEVLFLDEPSAGLDPQTRLLLWDMVREYNARGKTILLTTHNMEEADALCHRLAIVDRGRIIALGTPHELKQSIPGGHLIQLQVEGMTPEFQHELERLEGVTEVRSTDGRIQIYSGRSGSLVLEVVHLAAKFQVGIRDVHIAEPSLENLFLHHTGRSLRE